MAKYRVEMIEFKCIDETGIDVFGSDEVVFGCSSFKADKKRNKLRHTDATREFGNIDSGDGRFLGTRVGPCPKGDRRDPHCRKLPGAGTFFNEKELEQAGVLWSRFRFPEATPAGGLAAPFSVLVTGVEVDRGDAASVKKEIEDAASLIEKVAVLTGNGFDIPDEAKAKVSKVLGNDAIGVKAVNFAKPDLRKTLPDVGDFFHTNVRITGGDDGDIPLTGGGDYRVKLLVSRLS